MNINRHIQRGGILFYDSTEALQQIAMLKTNRITIYGIDSFKLTPHQTQPMLEHSIDYHDSKTNWDHASAFIASKANLGLMFEIIYDEDDSTN